MHFILNNIPSLFLSRSNMSLSLETVFSFFFPPTCLHFLPIYISPPLPPTIPLSVPIPLAIPMLLNPPPFPAIIPLLFPSPDSSLSSPFPFYPDCPPLSSPTSLSSCLPLPLFISPFHILLLYSSPSIHPCLCILSLSLSLNQP